MPQLMFLPLYVLSRCFCQITSPVLASAQIKLPSAPSA